MLRSGFLQGIILVFVFGKIHGLCLYRDSLAGIIFESAARIVNGTNAFFAAKHCVIFQNCAMDTVGAGTFHFFSKQHGGTLREMLFELYTKRIWISTLFSHFLRIKQEKEQKTCGKHPLLVYDG